MMINDDYYIQSLQSAFNLHDNHDIIIFSINYLYLTCDNQSTINIWYAIYNTSYTKYNNETTVFTFQIKTGSQHMY